MAYFQTFFDENKSNSIEYKGNIYHRYWPITVKNSVLLKFKFLSSNSNFIQAIVISFPSGFDGDVFLMGESLPVRKTAFPMLNFWEDTAPREIEILISNFCGEIKICNGSDPIGTKQFCKYLSEGCAMIVRDLDVGKYCFYCHDHAFGGDCDNLVFELVVVHGSTDE